jgi:hypothetical protein
MIWHYNGMSSTSSNSSPASRPRISASPRTLPIVDDGKVVGIVSRFDFSGLEVERLDEETGLWERI